MPTFLSQHFTLEELTFSQTAARQGINNTASPDIIANLRILAAKLEEVRAFLGEVPLIISSGYRGPALNAAVKGSLTSAHMNGLAADFTAPSYGDVLNVAQAIANSGIVFDQLIHEYGTWVHIGLERPGTVPRQQLLSIFKGTGYINGIIPNPG